MTKIEDKPEIPAKLEEGNFSHLPSGWTQATVSDVGDVVTGKTPSKSNANYYGKDYPFFKPTDLNAGFYVKSSRDGLSKEGIKKGKLVPERSILVTCIGATIGKTGFIRTQGASNQQINAIVTCQGLLPEFFYFMCISPQFQKSIISNSSSTTLPIINKTRFARLLLPIPPFPEQRRIVAKIEELFAQLDAGIESLRKVKAQLQRYGQAVLKYAFEGKLTGEWRKTHKDEIEPPEVLLRRIEEELRRKTGKRYEEFPPLDSSDLPELPEGWLWTRVGEIGLVGSGQTPKGINECSNEGEFPYFKVSDMNKTGNEKFMIDSGIHLSKDEIQRFRIHIQEKGTVIFPKRGGAIATNKKRILMKPSAYDLNIMGVYPLIIPPMYFYYWISKIDLIKLSDGSNVPQINHMDIKPLPFPLPPLLEEHKIVVEIERRLSITDKLEKVVEESLERAKRLRQSILKNAFKGKLVPQDPTDEPAEKLLERIIEEREM